MSKVADREVLFDVEIHTREAQVGSDSEQGVYAELMPVIWHASLPGMIFRHSYKLVSSSLNADAPSGAQGRVLCKWEICRSVLHFPRGV